MDWATPSREMLLCPLPLCNLLRHQHISAYRGGIAGILYYAIRVYISYYIDILNSAWLDPSPSTLRRTSRPPSRRSASAPQTTASSQPAAGRAVNQYASAPSLPSLQRIHIKSLFSPSTSNLILILGTKLWSLENLERLKTAFPYE